MGLHFGELYKLRNIVTVVISPHNLRPFAGAIKRGLPNIFRRTGEEILYVAPPLLIGYVAYNYLENEHARLDRKNPKDFENDV